MFFQGEVDTQTSKFTVLNLKKEAFLGLLVKNVLKNLLSKDIRHPIWIALSINASTSLK